MIKKYDIKKLIELMLVAVFIFTACYVGFSNVDERSHPLHGDLLINGNAIYNIHNNIPMVINGNAQWLDERIYYFYTTPLAYYFYAIFWDNSRSTIDNSVAPTLICVIFTYIVSYLFARRFFGRNVALLTIFLMSISSYWFNYVNRSLYGPWSVLPGLALLIYWLTINYLKSNKSIYLYSAAIFGVIGFYFTTWPLIVFVIPSAFLIILKTRSDLKLGSKIKDLGMFLLIFCAGVFIKEIIFIIFHLRFKGDPNGIQTFFEIFVQGRYGLTSGNNALKHFSFIHHFWGNLKGLFSIFFVPTSIYPGGNLVIQKNMLQALPLLTLLVMLTFMPGLVLMYRNKDNSMQSKIIVDFVWLTLFISFLLLTPVPRYLLPIFPLVYMASAFFIVKCFDLFKGKKSFRIVLVLIAAVGIIRNLNETFNIYMRKILPAYSDFKFNCYNSIQWPFEELKTYLKETKGRYDLIVTPNNFTTQMITYFRLWPTFFQKDGISFTKYIVNYDNYRKIVATKHPTLKERTLIVVNVYNQLLDDSICPGWSNLKPLDKLAITEPQIIKMLPNAKFIKYVGCAKYPKMLALYEYNL